MVVARTVFVKESLMDNLESINVRAAKVGLALHVILRLR